VSKHRLSLHGAKKSTERIKLTAIKDCFEGRIGLAEAIGLGPESIDALREQAVAFYRGGKWDRAAAILRGLVALEDVDPLDLVMLSRCYDELDAPEEAAIVASLASRLLVRLEEEVARS
jgi:hypothetical protein